MHELVRGDFFIPCPVGWSVLGPTVAQAYAGTETCIGRRTYMHFSGEPHKRELGLSERSWIRLNRQRLVRGTLNKSLSFEIPDAQIEPDCLDLLSDRSQTPAA